MLLLARNCPSHPAIGNTGGPLNLRTHIFHFIVFVRSYSQNSESDFWKQFPCDLIPTAKHLHQPSCPSPAFHTQESRTRLHKGQLSVPDVVMIPGGRSSVINSVASRTQTPCWAHSNEWGSSLPPAGISTFSGSHSFTKDMTLLCVSILFRNAPLRCARLPVTPISYPRSQVEISIQRPCIFAHVSHGFPHPFQASNWNQTFKPSISTSHLPQGAQENQEKKMKTDIKTQELPTRSKTQC